jgi:hypothetical protein
MRPLSHISGVAAPLLAEARTSDPLLKESPDVGRPSLTATAELCGLVSLDVPLRSDVLELVSPGYLTDREDMARSGAYSLKCVN